MSSSVHVTNNGKDILIFGVGAIQGLDDATLAAEAKYPINFAHSGKRFVLSLHYNGRNSLLFVNATKVYQFKATTSEIKDYALSLGKISKDFTINKTTKTILKGFVTFFSVGFNPMDNNDILDLHKYLMIRTWYKIMFGLIKKLFIGLLTGLVNGSNHRKCVLLSNQNARLNLPLLIYILINIVKNFTAINLQLN